MDGLSPYAFSVILLVACDPHNIPAAIQDSAWAAVIVLGISTSTVLVVVTPDIVIVLV